MKANSSQLSQERRVALVRRLETQPRPVTARVVSDLCGVELKTVHNWVASGQIEHFRTPGRHLRFQPSEVLRFLQARGYALQDDDKDPALLVTTSTARHWHVALEAYRVQRVGNHWQALIVAGRVRPAVIVLDTKPTTPDETTAFARACFLELPQTRLVLVRPAPRKSEELLPLRHRLLGRLRVEWTTPDMLVHAFRSGST